MDEMFKDMEKYAELQAYSSAQTKTILELNKKVNALEKENSQLKRTVSAASVDARKEKDKDVLKNSTDEQAICEMQLSILRDRSLEGELSMEEAKKVDMFARLLLQLRSPGKKQEDAVGKLDTKDLLKLVEGGLPDANG